jgi:hypothetical protein
MYCSTRSRADRALLLVSCSAVALTLSAGIAMARGDGDDHGRFFEHDSLVISSSTYDPTKGAVASLMVGTPLPDTATKTTAAVADNNYVTVWNNASVDGSFGVTSPIELLDVDPFSGRVKHSRAVPTDEVVTSFSSKSELGLHFVRDWHGSHLVFVAYAWQMRLRPRSTSCRAFRPIPPRRPAATLPPSRCFSRTRRQCT